MGLFDLFKKRDTTASQDIVGQLENMGYFKYADTNDIEELKKEVASSLKENNYLSTIDSDESPYNDKEFRHYCLDGEDLFEEGGFLDFLKEMKPTFDKIGLEMKISNHVEDWDSENDWLNHKITINDKEYIIFKNFKGYGWGEAAQRFAEMVNDQLSIHSKDERLYLANGGNDGRAIFLTEQQFQLLDPILKHPNDRPLRTHDWCKIMQVQPISF